MKGRWATLCNMAELYADRARWRNKPVRDISLILITLSIWCAVCGVKRLVEHVFI